MIYLLELSGLTILFFRSVDSYRNRELFTYSFNKLFKIIYFIYPLALIFTLLVGIFLFVSHNNQNFDILFSSSIICCCIIGFIKRSNDYFINYLEYDLEGLCMLCMVSLVLRSYFATELLSSLIFIISIASGLEKLKCESWKPSGLALISFLTLPWQVRFGVRNNIRKFFSTHYKNRLIFRYVIQSIQIFTPFGQIISGAFLLFAVFYSQSLIITNIMFISQILFALALYLVADLHLIPFMQLWVVLNFYCSYSVNSLLPSASDPNNTIIVLSIIYCLSFFVMAIIYTLISCPLNFHDRVSRFFSIFSLPVRPFSMFTLKTGSEILTHCINRSDSVLLKNPYHTVHFTRYSRNLINYLYSFDHFSLLRCKFLEEKSYANQLIYQQQFNSIVNFINSGEIYFYKHHWNQQRFVFHKSLYATLKVEMISPGVQRIYFHKISAIIS